MKRPFKKGRGRWPSTPTERTSRYGMALMYGGKAEEAIPFIEKGIRLNPYGPIWYYQNAGLAHLFSGQHEKALAYFKQAHRHSPQSPPVHRSLAVTYALLERQEEARTEAEEVMRLVPNFSVERFGRILPWHPTYSEIFVNGLRKAGLPD